ncbi:MAG: radical SAM protein, partial [Balneolaceae bacterium]
DFETKIIVKHDAPTLLKKSLSNKSWKPQTLVMSGVTDPYQPVEKELEITRECIRVLADCRHPLGIITKNHLLTRDIDLLKKLAKFDAVHVTLSITTLDDELARVMEPRTSRPERRLDAIRKLADAGIPAGVNIAPVIPGLTDHEMVHILEAAREAGAVRAGYLLLRLPYGVKDLFLNWLTVHFPGRRDKVVNRILDYRDGKLNRSEFGERFSGKGNFADQIRDQFRIHTQRLGYNRERKPLNVKAFRRPQTEQLNLF